MLGSGVWLAWKREQDERRSRRPAGVALLAAASYILVNLGIGALEVDRGLSDQLRAMVLIAKPVPFAFWRRELLLEPVWRWRRGATGTQSAGFCLAAARRMGPARSSHSGVTVLVAPALRRGQPGGKPLPAFRATGTPQFGAF